MLETRSPQYQFSFFTLALGLAVGFGTTLFTQTLSDRAQATYAALFLVSTVMALFFGGMAYREKRRSDATAATVRQRAGATP